MIFSFHEVGYLFVLKQTWKNVPRRMFVLEEDGYTDRTIVC